MSDFPHIAGRARGDNIVPACTCGNPEEGRPHLPDCASMQVHASQDRPGHVVGVASASASDEAEGSGGVSPTVLSTQAGCACEEILFQEAKFFEDEALRYAPDSIPYQALRLHAQFLQSLGDRIAGRKMMRDMLRMGQ